MVSKNHIDYQKKQAVESMLGFKTVGLPGSEVFWELSRVRGVFENG